MAEARRRAFCMVADQLAGAIERDRMRSGRRYTDYREISKRVGREMNRTLPQILKENDSTISTLSDLATICGCRLEIRMIDVTGPQPRGAQ